MRGNKGNPEARKNLKDMKLILSNLPKQKEGLPQKLAHNAKESTRDQILKNPTKSWQVFSDMLRKGKYNDKVMEFMQMPNAHDNFEKILKIKDPKEMTIGLMDAMNRISAQTAGKSADTKEAE